MIGSGMSFPPVVMCFAHIELIYSVGSNCTVSYSSQTRALSIIRIVWTSVLIEPVYRLAEQEWKDFVEQFTDDLIEVDPQIPPLPPKDVIHRIYRDVCIPFLFFA